MLRVTGDTLEGPRESDAFDVVSLPGGDLAIALLDLSTRHGRPGELAETLLSQAARSFGERTPLHSMMLDWVRSLLQFPGTELRATLIRCSVSEASVEVATAGMPPVACVHPDGNITVHLASSFPLTSTTRLPPAVEVVPLTWGSTWMAVSDGFTSGSTEPEAVRHLALALELPTQGLALSGSHPEALYDALAARVSESGRFARDDASFILLGADPQARFQSGIEGA